jgi:arylsulfatase
MRPNLLLITGDHVRSDLFEATDDGSRSSPLHPHIPTPCLDDLAASGVAFRNCHALDPICVPSRASLTTGCYPHRCTGTKENRGSIRPGFPRLAEYLRAQGFATYAIGKLHYLPYAAPGQPRTLHGFETAELCEEGRILQSFDPSGASHGLEDYHDFLREQGWAGYGRSHGVGNNDVHPASVPFPAELHEEAWVATRSIAALTAHQQQSADQPFFLWASFAKPHPPYDPPAPYDRLIDPRSLPRPAGIDLPGDFEDRDPELRARRKRFGWDLLSPEAVQYIRAAYGGLVSFQDAMLARLLGHLEASGLSENTVVVYTADHGDLLGDFGRFFKSSMLDASVKVPLIIRSPRHQASSGQRRDHLVGLHDLLPTLSSLAGLPLPSGIDGQDLSPILENEQEPGRDRIVCQCFDTPGQKYLIRSHDWKYVYHEILGTEELYRVGEPDYELGNLAATHPEITASFRKELEDWCADQNDPMMLDNRGRLKISHEALRFTSEEFDMRELGWRRY